MLILKNYRANLVTIFGFTRGRAKSKKMRISQCKKRKCKTENKVFGFLFFVFRLFYYLCAHKN